MGDRETVTLYRPVGPNAAAVVDQAQVENINDLLSAIEQRGGPNCASMAVVVCRSRSGVEPHFAFPFHIVSTVNNSPVYLFALAVKLD